MVRATSETVLAEKGEDREALLRRLARQYGVGPLDSVEIVFKGGAPQYAVIEWGTTGAVDAASRGKSTGY